MRKRWVTNNWVRAFILTLVVILAVWNLLAAWLSHQPTLPLEWVESPEGLVVFRVTNARLRDSIPENALWVAVDNVALRTSEDVERWLKTLEPGQVVKLKFVKTGFYIVPWKVETEPLIPRLWVWITGALLLAVAAWISPRFGLSQFHRRLWATALALSLIYLFSPIGRWHAIDWIFWLLDRLGFALAPAALIHWALSWGHRPLLPTWRLTRKIWPILWFSLHLAFAFTGLFGIWDLWSPSYRIMFHRILWADWALLALAAMIAVGFGLTGIPRLRGTEKSRLQLITGSLVLAYLPSTLVLIPLLLQGGGQPWSTLAVLFHPILPLGLAIAVTRYRWDVEHLFRSGLINISLMLGLGAMYSVIFGLIHWAFQNDTLAQIFMMSLIATIPGIFAYPILRDWMSQAVDRYYFGARSRPREELERMLWRDLNILPIESWLTRMLSLLNPALETQWTNVLLYAGPGEPSWITAATPPAFIRELVEHVDNRATSTPGIGRPVRPGIVRIAGPSVTVYRIECPVDTELKAVFYLMWNYPDHWLGRDDVELLTRLQKRVTLALQNFRLFNEVQQRAEILENLQRFQYTVIHALDVGILLTDLDHRTILLSNRTVGRWLNTTPEAMENQSLLDFFPDFFVQKVRQYFDTLSARPESGLPLLKAYLHNPQGRTILLQITRRTIEVPVGDQTVAGYLYVMEDITRQHQLEQQLIQSEKLSSIGLLAAGIAHEINTPLTGIASYTQMLLQKDFDENTRRLLGRIHDLSDQMKQIVQTLLDMAQPQRQTEQVVVLQEVVQRALRLLNPHLKNTHVDIKLDLDEQPVRVFGNEAQLHQVLSNLILNARDAMPEGGTLSIRVYADPPWAILTIRDTGIGMDEQTRNRIFDPFFTTKAGKGGTGLGLTITYHLVRQAGGRIEVESAPGEGTTFRVQIPLFTGERQRHGVDQTAARR